MEGEAGVSQLFLSIGEREYAPLACQNNLGGGQTGRGCKGGGGGSVRKSA